MNVLPGHPPRRKSGYSHRLLVAASVLATLPALLPAGPAEAAPAVQAQVRVDQVGYAGTASKRAYLMTGDADPGATFRVVDARGDIVYQAAVGADQGSWSSTYTHVYALDFDGVRRQGSYHIVATIGSVEVRSPVFRIDSAARIYAVAMANALAFYQNERDGPGFIPSALRSAPGHLNDANAMTYLIPRVNGNGNFDGDLTPLGVTIDAAGGWWDAGDYLKFTETTSYVVAMMETDVRNFPNQLGNASATNFTAEAAFGLDWLEHMWNDTTKTLYLQVGIGAGNSHFVSDHDIWRLPQADDTYGGTNPQDRYIRNRPVFRAGAPGSLISPNLAGRLAASFALCYQLDRLSEPARAAACLTNAEDVFALANTHPGRLQTAIPYGFYPEKEWRDDLEWGATEIYDALSAGPVPAGVPSGDATYYLRQAAHWAHAYINGPNDAADSLNLYDVSGLAHFDLARAIAHAGTPAGLEVTRGQLLADIAKQLSNAVTQSGTDPFGFGFPWDTFDTTTHGAGLVVMASEYDALTGTRAFAGYDSRWLGNILGANAWGTSLIVGDGGTFPACMQQQVANLVGSLNGSPPVLAGAAVEGPNSFAATGVVAGMRTCPANGVDAFAQFNSATAVYQDNVQSWSTVEPAIDLTASSPMAFAWQINNDPSVP